MTEYKGIINKFETFGLVDGPGVRFVVFLQGCNMRCKYCHNPEMLAKTSEKAQILTAKQVFEIVCKYKSYWGQNGGITVSGGEPLLQIDFLIQLFKLAKKNGVHTALDTSCQPFENNVEYLKKFDKLLAVTDLFIVDIKMFDTKKHRELTGYDNTAVLDMIKYLSAKQKPMWIRRVLVPKLTDSKQDLQQMADFIESLNSVERVEVLPYHTLGIPKWQQMGMKYSLSKYAPPTEKQVKNAEKILKIDKYNK